jgi:hypothetical protein
MPTDRALLSQRQCRVRLCCKACKETGPGPEGPSLRQTGTRSQAQERCGGRPHWRARKPTGERWHENVVVPTCATSTAGRPDRRRRHTHADKQVVGDGTVHYLHASAVECELVSTLLTV